MKILDTLDEVGFDAVAAVGAAVRLQQPLTGQQLEYFAGGRSLHTDPFGERLGAENLALPGQFHHHADGVVGHFGYLEHRYTVPHGY